MNEALVRRREVTLVDLVDRLLGGGVVVSGDITLAVADVDLVRISLRALVASVDAVAQAEPRQQMDAPADAESRLAPAGAAGGSR